MNHFISWACPGRLVAVLLALAVAAAPPIAQAGWKTRLHPAAATVGEAQAATVFQAVKAALANRGWKVSGEAPGRIYARLKVREHAATIRIDYDPAEVSFVYIDSANLDHLVEDGATHVHRNYYNWIGYLGADIGLDLAGQPLTR